MQTVQLFSLKLISLPPKTEVPFHLIPLVRKDELFISASSRLCGLEAMAHIESKELAEEFKNFNVQKLKNKYGDGVEIEVVSVEASNIKGVEEKIRKDSNLIKKRLAQAKFN